MYTKIHQEYEPQVEADIKNHLGEEKMAQLLAGLEGYAQSGQNLQSPAVIEAVDVLVSLSDFPSRRRCWQRKPR